MAIGFDALTTGGGTTSTSHSHTFAANANYALIGVSMRDGGGAVVPVSSLTVDGQAATFLGGIGVNSMRVELWEFKNPPSGAKTVAATSAAPNDQMLTSVRSWIGVNTADPRGPVATNGDTNNLPTTTATTNTGEVVLDVGATVVTASSITPGADQTEDYEILQGGNLIAWASRQDGINGGEMSHTMGVAIEWRLAAVSIKPAPAATDIFWAGVIG